MTSKSIWIFLIVYLFLPGLIDITDVKGQTTPATTVETKEDKENPEEQSMALYELIGLNINDKKFQSFLNKLDQQPEILKFNDSFFYVFKTKGIDFKILKPSNKIDVIYLFSEGSDKHRQYQGVLPYSLEFTDTRKTVEKKLGPADVNYADGVSNFFCCWNSKNIVVIYNSINKNNMNIGIESIQLSDRSKYIK